jgi:hypothetical protein
MMPTRAQHGTLRRARIFKAESPASRKGGEAHNFPGPGAPTSGRKSRVSGGGGERDKHHTHEDRERS